MTRSPPAPQSRRIRYFIFLCAHRRYLRHKSLSTLRRPHCRDYRAVIATISASIHDRSTLPSYRRFTQPATRAPALLAAFARPAFNSLCRATSYARYAAFRFLGSYPEFILF
jgi:hypothetical protein